MSNKRVRGIAIHRPIIYGNVAHIIPPLERTSDHTHRWCVAVKSAASPIPASEGEEPQIGGLDDISYFVKKVQFKLHETIPNSLRTIEKPPFEVHETGWGEFEVQIKIFFANEAAEKPLTFFHHLKLHPWPASLRVGPSNILPAPPPPLAEPESVEPTQTEAAPPTAEEQKPDIASQPQPQSNLPPSEPMQLEPVPAPAEPVYNSVNSWQYDEIVFTEPSEAFYSTLLSHPVTPLPLGPRLPRPVNNLPIGAGGNIGELTMETERLEGARLEEARKQTLVELEAMRTRLVEGEKALVELRRELDGA